MYLTELSLSNFRNFENLHLQLKPRFNLIVGKNAQGKTNLLEAIYYLGFLSSFRTSVRSDILKQGKQESLLITQIVKEGLRSEVRILLEKSKRSIRVNGKKPNLVSDFYGLIPVLLFEPSEVYLFRESPSHRRKFINRALFLDDPSIIETIRRYDEVITQRNRLLKEGGSFDFKMNREVWDQQLIELGSTIVFKRLQLIGKINSLLTEEYQKIAHGDESAQLQYTLNGWECEIPLSPLEIGKILKTLLVQREGEEARRRETLVGPHRDDWQFLLKNLSMGALGSQGENRSGVIALKAVQIRIYEKTHGVPPLFLLDDVASELDPQRAQALFSTLANSHGQVFLTSPSTDGIPRYLVEEGSTFVVENGFIAPLSE